MACAVPAATRQPALDYPHDVPSLFRRRSRTATQPSVTSDESDRIADEPDQIADDANADGQSDQGSAGPRAGVKPKAYTPGKGRATPKRKEARKRAAEPPPQDRKAAMRRMREKQRTERAAAREGLMRGEDQYLPARDRGPERALTRDIVDARRNIGTWFFAGAVVILIGTWPGVSQPIRDMFNMLWTVLLVAVIVDSALLCRTIGRVVWERHPKTGQRKAGLYFYAIMRSLTIRRMRIPRPRVAIGTKI